MCSVTYSMSVSLDGYIVGPDGGFDSTAPDEEVFRFATDEVREVGVHLLGKAEPGTAASRSAARLSPPRRPRWA
ncbi:hypothetical protein QFZ24_000644 [Streptomyces phaeochromogenes]|nr:hypothetical protein [Streptomyces phaeochromogenes]